MTAAKMMRQTKVTLLLSLNAVAIIIVGVMIFSATNLVAIRQILMRAMVESVMVRSAQASFGMKRQSQCIRLRTLIFVWQLV